jgi:hypothetical protein
MRKKSTNTISQPNYVDFQHNFTPQASLQVLSPTDPSQTSRHQRGKEQQETQIGNGGKVQVRIKTKLKRMASCHVAHTGNYFINKVKQRWARLVLGWVTAQITSMLGAVRRCTHIL